MSENFPKFFQDVPSISLYDPLAHILGSVNDGVIKFNYKQIVKAAGHSCPTVAGAYLVTLKALEILYPNSLPVRGEIKVAFKDALQSGVTGVISNVITNITGATKESGFKGLNGKYARHSLMEYAQAMSLQIKFTRVDTNESVEIAYDPSVVPPLPKMQELMQKVLQNDANEMQKEFGQLWQERVKRVLIDNFNNDKMIVFKKG